MTTKKIFLASSSELEEDRQQFEIFINRKNKEWNARDVFLELVVWEDFLDAVSKTRLQDEYNKAIVECDLFVMLFSTKVGKYTEEEFETALRQFQATDKPLIYTYYKDVPISLGSAKKEDVVSLLAFLKRLDEDLKHFYTPYKNIDELKFHFDQQLDKLSARGFFEPAVATPSSSDAEAASAALVRRARSGDARAMAELSRSDDPNAFEVISSVLRTSPQETIREAAVNALANLDDPKKVALLGETLLSEKWLVAAACAQVLGRSKDPSAVPYLLRALQIRVDWLVAKSSAEALGFFKPTEAITKSLVKALNRGSFEGQAGKQSLIGHGIASVTALIENLKQSPSSEALLYTIQALGAIGDQRAVAALEEARHKIDATNSTMRADLQCELTNALESLSP
jgi:hypothetical protein